MRIRRWWMIAALILMAGLPLGAQMRAASPFGEEAWRIACGTSTDVYDEWGNCWMKDEVFSPGRWGHTENGYRLAVPNGEYRLRLITAPAGKAQPVAEAVSSVTVTNQIIDIPWRSRTAALTRIEVTPILLTDDNFLDFIQKTMFEYVRNESDPDTGLIKDVEVNGFEGRTHTMASIAATGFGLTAFTIAAERGWMPMKEAHDRVLRTLRVFQQHPRFTSVHGFWYHFPDMQGNISLSDEVSTVDSAIFIMGALQAGAYFDEHGYDDISALAESLYRRMEWRAFSGLGGPMSPFISMAWSPAPARAGNQRIAAGWGGSFVANYWSGYCESVFVDLLAIGSPTFPAGVEAWTRMDHPWFNSGSITDPYFAHYVSSDPEPLFLHQYHNLYYDLRNVYNRREKGDINYFVNAMTGTREHINYCRDNASTYPPGIWGLTACRTPTDRDGYAVYGILTNDGTVAPTAAITSIMVTPEESTKAARLMYFQYKHRLWGRYGYTDAFNVKKDYSCPLVCGIDQIPMIIAIENLRSGMPWRTFMANYDVQRGMQAAGFRSYAEGPLACASAVTEGHEAWRALDGDPATSWSSGETPASAWLYVDYGSTRTISGVTVTWADAAQSYQIKTSTNGVDWTPVYTRDVGRGGSEHCAFAQPVAMRYLLVCGRLPADAARGYAIQEVVAR